MRGREIIVNGREYTTSENTLTYEKIVSLIGRSASAGVAYTITVSFRRPSTKKGVMVTPGGSVQVENGMIINCTNTNNA